MFQRVSKKVSQRVSLSKSRLGNSMADERGKTMPRSTAHEPRPPSQERTKGKKHHSTSLGTSSYERMVFPTQTALRSALQQQQAVRTMRTVVQHCTVDTVRQVALRVATCGGIRRPFRRLLQRLCAPTRNQLRQVERAQQPLQSLSKSLAKGLTKLTKRC